MGRTLDWIMPILETDSIETLSMRQDMIYLTNMRKWDEVQKMLDVLCKKMGTEACQKPRIQQEIQSIRATKLFSNENDSAERGTRILQESVSMYVSSGMAIT